MNVPDRPGGRTAVLVFGVIVAACAVYGLVFAYRGSLVHDGTRYFTLFDDAMVSMTYARNLAAGHGLVWNAGEPPVEGYTNLGWTLYMTLWHLLPLGAAKLPLMIQLSGLGLLLWALVLVRSIGHALAPQRPWIGTAAALLTASYLPLIFWSLRGMEVPALVVLLLLAVRRTFRALDQQRSDRWLFPLLAVGIVVRIDFVVPYAVVAAFLFALQPRQRWRNAAAAATVLALVLGLETLFRLAYYGDPLPNTYYLKVAGVPWWWRVHRGLATLGDFISAAGWWPFVLPLGALALRRRDRRPWLLGALLVSQLAYSVHVGGDGWEWWGHGANRYVLAALPGWFVLLALGLADALALARRAWLRAPPALWAALAPAVLLLTVVQLHGGLRGQLLHDLLNVTGAHVEDDRTMTRYGLELKQLTREDARIAVYWAGAIPYYSERRGVDILGKSDRWIAHRPARIRSYREFHPGHNKWDFAHSLDRLEPDVLAHGYDVDAAPFLGSYRSYRVTDPAIAGSYNRAAFFRKDSRRLHWDRVEQAAWLRPVPFDPTLLRWGPE